MLNTTRIDEFVSWGFNVVRLGTMWSGVVVAPNKVNDTYLHILETIVEMLGKRGMYVILDMHQDGLSTKYGMYDGVPRWLIDSFPDPLLKYPLPFTAPPSNWMLNYVTYACTEAFKHIYNNQSGALDHLGFFWSTVAKRLGHYDNVLGYEIMNEPFPGNVYTDPTLFIPGRTGSTELQPMYDKIAPYIRAVDNTSMIFYEPVTWGMILHGSELGTGFTHVPGGKAYSDRSVLSFHYYCWFAGAYNKNPFPVWLRELCDHMFFPDVLSSVGKDITDTGGGHFLTEYGNCQATAPKNSTEYQECLSVLSTSDSRRVSWTYWDSDFFNSDGSAIMENVMLFSRTYAVAVSGVVKSTDYDDSVHTYKLQYLPANHSTSATVIYVSFIHYPKGFKVSTSNANFKIMSGYYVEITAVSTAQVTVTVSSK